MTHLDRGKLVLNLEIEELKRLVDRLDNRFTQAVDLLRTTMEAGNKVIVLGIVDTRAS